LIDGAFQTLFGAPFLGQQESDEPYLPTRVRSCAVYGPPEQHMTVRVSVVSATREAVESDITITGRSGDPLVVVDGFVVQSLTTSSRMSADHIDKGLYDIAWSPKIETTSKTVEFGDDEPAARSWLVFVDDSGLGAHVTDGLRRRGDRVHTVEHRSVEAPTSTDAGYVINPRRPEHVAELLERHLDSHGDLDGIVDCWPLDIASAHGDQCYDIGALTVLRLAKAIAGQGGAAARLYLVTGNAQPVAGSRLTGVDQAALWGLGRVIGHQELPERWGGLIDVDADADPGEGAELICEHLLDDDAEDQIAIRDGVTFVPRLRPCRTLTKPFPTKLTPDATYVVTGGTGALGRVVATYLAERGARHITLLSRSAIPPRDRWPTLTDDDPHFAAVAAIKAIERLGAHVATVSVDVADAERVNKWIADHNRAGGRAVRGIVHTAGSVADHLLVNMSEEDFAKVLAPKVTGTRVLHDAFRNVDLEFFVMFGSAGSTIASPGQANYAAANAFLDAFAYYRQAQGLPALTIGWGPWSVGMVEELALEKIYAQRGIELISPAVGARILDRLIGQRPAHVVAITADWNRARQAGLAARLPMMFSELDAAGATAQSGDADSSVIELLAVTAEADRPAVIAERVQRVVATVFDCATADIDPDDMLDDIGLDSMMAMEFRVRINTMFSIDIPVLEILQGVSVHTLTARILAELHAIYGDAPAAGDESPPRPPIDDVDQLMEELSDADLRELLAELEASAGEPNAGSPS
ncbi:MAG: type I polyketide synthase, partial [Candidatus Sericytochromatia bacterium]